MTLYSKKVRYEWMLPLIGVKFGLVKIKVFFNPNFGFHMKLIRRV